MPRDRTAHRARCRLRRFWESVMLAKLDGKLPHSQQFLRDLAAMLETGDQLDNNTWHECIICHRPTKQHIFAHDVEWDRKHSLTDTFTAPCIKQAHTWQELAGITIFQGGSIALR